MLKFSWMVLFTLQGICSHGQSPEYSGIDYNLQWPSFRGPHGVGFIESAKTPEKWDARSGEHILWKTPIPGLGHSCPVIWGDRLFITTSCSVNGSDSLKVGLYGDIDEADNSSVHDFKVYCLDKNSGKILWEKTAFSGVPKSKRHTKSSQANCTPATDGHYLVVHFGSEGLYCFDLEGKLLWKKDMGILNPGPYTDPGVEWGYASSPVIWKDRVLIQCDIPAGPYITALQLASGKEIWKTERTGEVSTWCTPALCEEKGRVQVIANGYKKISGYDVSTGQELWTMSGGGDAPAPTPVIANGLIYINSAHGASSPIFAIRPDALGDISLMPDSTHNRYVVWSIRRGGAYMQTPLVYKGLLYNLQVNGQLTCFDALNGSVQYKEPLKEAFTASAIAAGDRVYFSSENGIVFVIKSGPVFQLLAKNNLNDICMATPAISGNRIYFRTSHFVLAVE